MIRIRNNVDLYEIRIQVLTDLKSWIYGSGPVLKPMRFRNIGDCRNKIEKGIWKSLKNYSLIGRTVFRYLKSCPLHNATQQESRYWTGRLFISFCSYNIQHCFICRPSDSTVPTDAGIEPWTVATCALAVRRSNH
jgi:hypothetical protein